MRERTIRIIDEKRAHGIIAQIAETSYEFGSHFVLFLNGQAGFHSTDYDKVKNHMNSILGD